LIVHDHHCCVVASALLLQLQPHRWGHLQPRAVHTTHQNLQQVLTSPGGRV
jgi:hypothetical protein